MLSYDDALTRAHDAALNPFKFWNKLEDEISAQSPDLIRTLQAQALTEHRHRYHDAAMVILTMADYALNPSK